MGMYILGQRAQLNTNTNRTEVVTEHAHTYRNTCDTPIRFVVPREIVGSGGFRSCWPRAGLMGSEREAIVCTQYPVTVCDRDYQA
jgi:hypothetical protein